MADINAVIDSYAKLTNTVDGLNNVITKTTGTIKKLNTALTSTNSKMNSLAKSTTGASTGMKKLASTNVDKKLKALGTSAEKATKKLKQLGNADKKLKALGTSAEKATKKLRQLGNTKAGDKLNAIQNSAAKAAGSLRTLSQVKVKNVFSELEKSSKSTFGSKIKQLIGGIGKKIGAIKTSARDASKQVLGLAKKLFSLDSLAKVKKGMDFVDSYTMTNEKLKLINGGTEADPNLQNRINAAANNSRSGYNDTVNNISGMKAAAGDSFGSTDELIAFTELLQKGSKIGGTSTEQQGAAMSQMTDAMSVGSLGEDAFKSILTAAPGIAEAIATYTGKSNDELMNMAAQGQLTADLLKNAMFSSSSQINQDFQNMPITFDALWTRMKNGAFQSISGILEKISALADSDGFSHFVDGICIAFDYAAQAAEWLVDTIVSGWDLIGPILAFAGGVLLTAMVIHLWAMIPPLIAQGVAWLSALWPILLLVGIIMVAIAAARHFGASWEEIAGVVGGIIGGIAAFFGNVFIYLWNRIAAFVNFFGNVFKDPIGSIKILFLDLVVNVLGFIENIAQGIEDLLNKIPGVEIDITSGIKGVKDNIAKKSANIKSEMEWVEIVKSKDLLDYSVAIENGGQNGKDLLKTLENGLPDYSEGGNEQSYKPYTDIGTSGNPMSVTTEDNAEVNIADEDLRYLRDIAERDYINNLSTATLAPNISVQFGDVHETADAEQVAKRVQTIMQEEIAMMSEGVYAYG